MVPSISTTATITFVFFHNLKFYFTHYFLYIHNYIYQLLLYRWSQSTLYSRYTLDINRISSLIDAYRVRRTPKMDLSRCLCVSKHLATPSYTKLYNCFPLSFFLSNPYNRFATTASFIGCHFWKFSKYCSKPDVIHPTVHFPTLKINLKPNRAKKRGLVFAPTPHIFCHVAFPPYVSTVSGTVLLPRFDPSFGSQIDPFSSLLFS